MAAIWALLLDQAHPSCSRGLGKFIWGTGFCSVAEGCCPTFQTCASCKCSEKTSYKLPKSIKKLDKDWSMQGNSTAIVSVASVLNEQRNWTLDEPHSRGSWARNTRAWINIQLWHVEGTTMRDEVYKKRKVTPGHLLFPNSTVFCVRLFVKKSTACQLAEWNWFTSLGWQLVHTKRCSMRWKQLSSPILSGEKRVVSPASYINKSYMYHAYSIFIVYVSVYIHMHTQSIFKLIHVQTLVSIWQCFCSLLPRSLWGRDLSAGCWRKLRLVYDKGW